MKRAGAFFALALIASPLALAQETGAAITAFDPPSVAAALRARNYPADVRRTDDGAWFVSARLNNIPFQAILLNCPQGSTRCSDLQLFARIESPEPASAARINDFNSRARFVRAYLDAQGRPVLEMDLSAEGGVGPGNIAAALDLWGGALQSFAAHVGPQRPSAAARP